MIVRGREGKGLGLASVSTARCALDSCQVRDRECGNKLIAYVDVCACACVRERRESMMRCV